MLKSRFVFALIFSYVLSGCGGGGGSEESALTQATSPSQPTTPPPPPPPAPTPKTLTIQTQTVNRCDVYAPQTDSILVVHNDDFSQDSIHNSDENGIFAVDFITDRATISVVSKSKRLDQPETLNIDTYFGVTITDLGVINNQYELVEDARCECTLSDISLSNNVETEYPLRSNIGVDSEQNGGRDFVAGTVFKQHEICRDITKDWPALGATMEFGNGISRRVYTGKLTEYVPAAELFLEINNLERQIPIQLNDENPGQPVVFSFGINDEGTQYFNLTFEESSGAVVFADDNLSFTGVVAAKTDNSENYISLPDHRIYTRSLRSIDATQTEILDFDYFDRQVFSASVEETLSSDNYDFSRAIGADAFTLTTQLLDANSQVVLNWQIVAAPQGSFAGLDNFSIDQLDLTIDNESIPQRARVNWILTDYPDLETYDQYIERFSSTSSTPQLEPVNQITIDIQAEIDDTSVFPLGGDQNTSLGKVLTKALPKKNNP